MQRIEQLTVHFVQLADVQLQHSADIAEISELQSQIQELQVATSQAVDEMEAQATANAHQKAELEKLRKQLKAQQNELSALQSANSDQAVLLRFMHLSCGPASHFVCP